MGLEASTVRNFLQCLIALVVLTACSGKDNDDVNGAADQPPNVLLVVVDTLRADHLGIYGYQTAPTSPFLDQLASESLIVDGLKGVTSWTMPSMASLYTGKLPAEHRVMRMTGKVDASLQEPQTLAAQFRQGGYATACMMSNFLLLSGRGFNEGFDVYDDKYARKPDPHRGSTAADVADGGIDWLKKQDGKKPWFLNLHFFDPHTSYEDHPSWSFTDPAYSGWVKGGLGDKDYKANQATSTAEDRRQLAALYDEEIRAVDEALARVAAHLKQSGQWQNTIVIVTSDHGEELAERGYIGHTRTLHFEQVDLPLLIRLPNHRSVMGKRRGLMGQAQLYNTMLELAGLPTRSKSQPSAAPWLLSNEGGSARDMVFFEVDFVPVKPAPDRFVRKRGMQWGMEYKLVVDRKAGLESFYDLQADPGEWKNVITDSRYADQVKQMRSHMAAHTWY